MDVVDAIRTRRTIRHFKPDPVNDEVIESLIESANWAPSWANSQCWRFIIVRDVSNKTTIANTLHRIQVDGDLVKNAAMEAIKQAPVLVVACAEMGKAGYRHDGAALTNKAESWYIFDVALAMQNLVLAAHALGLGTCIVGGFDADKVEKLLNIPSNMHVVTMTPVGFPSQPGVISPRKKTREVMFNEVISGK